MQDPDETRTNNARCNYVSGAKLVALTSLELPAIDSSHQTRIVAISDTHMVHDQLQLPAGDVLVHAGDILTESFLRHTKDNRNARGVLSRLFGGGGSDEKEEPQMEAKASGVALFETFAQWFCAQKHEFKILIAGNHDGALEAMGATKIREILDRYAVPVGSVVYLEYEYAQLDSLRVFGSPFGSWGSHNDAFSICEGHKAQNVMVIEPGTHIVITHSPPVLPGRDGALKEHGHHEVEAMVSAKTQLSISGHCHWAYGLYHPRGIDSTKFIVASSCDSKWESRSDLKGDRHDRKWDLLRGGYNLRDAFLPCVIDINVPKPKTDSKWNLI